MLHVLFYQSSCTSILICLLFYRTAFLICSNVVFCWHKKVDVTDVGCKEGNIGQQYLIRFKKPSLGLTIPTEQTVQWSKTGIQNNLTSEIVELKSMDGTGERGER